MSLAPPAKITAELIAQTHVEKGGPRIEWRDPDCKGLLIRISHGAKSFAFKGKLHGKDVKVTIGHYPDMSLPKARRDADKLRVANASGRDVRQEKHAAVASTVAGMITFRQLADDYLDAPKTRKKRSWAIDERHLNTFCEEWGRRAAASITRDEINDHFTARAKKAPQAALRSYATLRRVFNWAIGAGKWPEGQASPMMKMEKPAEPEERKRSLSTDELRAVWQELINPESDVSETMRNALRLILLTAQRPGEVGGLVTRELQGDVWTIPGERSKNKRAHAVPLTGPALSIIKHQLAGRPEGNAVFMSRTFGDRPLSRHSLPHATAQIATALKLPPFTAHDLRRTAANLMRARGVAPHIVDDVLNHTPGKLQRIYQDGFDPKPQRLAALEVLATAIDTINETGKPAKGRKRKT